MCVGGFHLLLPAALRIHRLSEAACLPLLLEVFEGGMRTGLGSSIRRNHARRTVGIRMTQPTTERLVWHCGAHTAKPESPPGGRFLMFGVRTYLESSGLRDPPPARVSRGPWGALRTRAAGGGSPSAAQRSYTRREGWRRGAKRPPRPPRPQPRECALPAARALFGRAATVAPTHRQSRAGSFPRGFPLAARDQGGGQRATPAAAVAYQFTMRLVTNHATAATSRA